MHHGKVGGALTRCWPFVLLSISRFKSGFQFGFVCVVVPVLPLRCDWLLYWLVRFIVGHAHSFLPADTDSYLLTPTDTKWYLLSRPTGTDTDWFPLILTDAPWS